MNTEDALKALKDREQSKNGQRDKKRRETSPVVFLIVKI
jgi:hypothetical protein